MNPLQHVVNQLNTVTTERNQLRTALVTWKRAVYTRQAADFSYDAMSLRPFMEALEQLIPDDDWGIE